MHTIQLSHDKEIIMSHKRRYTPGLAMLKFKPNHYLTPKEAQQRYNDYSHLKIESDTISFEDCIPGMREFPPNCVDLVIADPPFGLNFSGKESVYNRKKNLVLDSYHEINNEYSQFTETWLALIQRIMKPEATAYIFSGWNHLEDILRAARLCNLYTINHIIWKYQFGVFTKKKFVTSHYHIILLAKDINNYFFNKMEHYPEDVWDIKRKYRKGEIKNATTLPFELVKKCIEFSSKPGDLVFDPFMGMGTTAIAAKSLWRHYSGFEINRNLIPSINKEIDEISPGQEYLSLNEKLKELRTTAQKKYPSAYKLFLKGNGGEINVES